MCLQFSMHMTLYLLPHFWAAGRRPYIVFTFTGSVRNVRNNVIIYIYMYIYICHMYIYICQQHGGRKVGTKSFGYISVKFIRLLLILSAKGLLDQKSSSKYYFSQ